MNLLQNTLCRSMTSGSWRQAERRFSINKVIQV
jgi:hypothetical protein